MSDESSIAPQVPFPGDEYITPANAGAFESLWPSFFFTWYVVDIIRHDGRLAAAGRYRGREWVEGSRRTVRLLERCGVRFHFSGMDNIDRTAGPCVFVGNHMSTLETFVLPSLIQPRKPVTFVVKESLLKYPWFGPVLDSRNPVVVRRVNPREDFSAVMEGGAERLAAGRSVIVFPQSTRTPFFDPAAFNSMGIKLAKRAGVPVIPVALRTDAWANGKYIKDYGGINPAKAVHIRFGEALGVIGNGRVEHAEVCAFIGRNLEEWGMPGLASGLFGS
ncbi:MAG: 1-acyl-sn-glycerol-3-phosphate acyltransferase [Desulfovibrio sp.]|jgi:1-acyl-sn-glycerol-3-phosphate acyltransferase|nr:1-acyl-sn-glycerol-3-phosphate acyltransferase [Desulfovibrio sp.]